MEPQPPTIAVWPPGAVGAHRRLFAALETALPVRFADASTAGGADAHLGLGAEPRADGATPQLVLGADAAGPRMPVELLRHPAVDRRIRGTRVADRPAGPALDGDAAEVLALLDGAPAWTRAGHRQRVRAAVRELGADEVLYRLLSERPLATVALVAFLRELTAATGWRPPPLRASVVFDDPNLRWRSYGYIDYRRLLAHADAHGYHATMAMIPLDAGWTHGPTAALFRERPDRLSLVLHGNDHLKGELMTPRDRAGALAMMAQALRRVAAFERRSGVAVDRVMMPPHGLCSRHVTAALAALPFDALFAIYPLPWTDAPPTGPPLAGWEPAQFVDGCAVIPRVPLSSSRADLALRAFLDHPIVLYGHHDDVREGLDLLADQAAVVNGFGDVRWQSPAAIAAANHAMRPVGDVLQVRPYARRVVVEAPAGARELRVEAPGDALDPGALVGWSLRHGRLRPFGASVPLASGGRVEIRLRGRSDTVPSRVTVPAWRPWPRLRRRATEVRDRLQPLRRR